MTDTPSKAHIVVKAALQLADELEKEGKPEQAQAFRDLRLCRLESLERLYDILKK